MSRYIDAEKLVANKFKNDISYKAFCNLVDRQPTANVAPVRHGKWIYADDCGSLYDSYWCNNCHRRITVDAERRCDIGFVVEDLKFCPNCGAKMDGGEG